MSFTWNNGPPCDLPGKSWYHRNIVQEKPVKLRPCQSGLPVPIISEQAGLGQGMLEQSPLSS